MTANFDRFYNIAIRFDVFKMRFFRNKNKVFYYGHNYKFTINYVHRAIDLHFH